MNLRQKAKHFKKLYEVSLPQKPYPVVYKTLLPTHYKIQTFMPVRDVEELQTEMSEVLKAHIENRILDNLKPIIWNNLKSERDYYRDVYSYWLDVWIEERGDGNDN